jgi:hypothetical protein
LFSIIRENYLNDERFRLLQVAMMTAPDKGVVIRGSGGIRKLRWSTSGVGKRGGLRVLYYWVPNRDTIHLLSIYRKSEVSNMTAAEIKILRKIVHEIDTSQMGKFDA